MRPALFCLAVLMLACDGGDATDPDAGGTSGGGNSTTTGGDSGAQSNGAATTGSDGGDGGQGGDGGTGGNETNGSSGSSGDVPTIAGCPIFSADDAWNTSIEQAPVNVDYTSRLVNYLAAQGNPNLHPDFGAEYQGMPFGIPFNVVAIDQAKLPITFDYDDESDVGPYPFPGPDAVKIEGGDPRSDDGDRHVLALQQGTCKVWEAWACKYGSQWECGSGAVFDLAKNSYGQRPKGYTSADAAGLSILAGLIRYDEVQAGVIKHAIRFTLSCTTDAFTKPASHFAVPNNCDADDPNAMPMGVRVRLKSSFDVSGLRGAAKIVAEAMKTYGLILADNGSNFYFQGEADARWNDEHLNDLKDIPSTAFEVVGPVAPEK
jgi:hypothetical protein